MHDLLQTRALCGIIWYASNLRIPCLSKRRYVRRIRGHSVACSVERSQRPRCDNTILHDLRPSGIGIEFVVFAQRIWVDWSTTSLFPTALHTMKLPACCCYRIGNVPLSLQNPVGSRLLTTLADRCSGIMGTGMREHNGDCGCFCRGSDTPATTPRDGYDMSNV